MKVLPILIIPILMITDYALTVWGARLSNEKYRQHFKTKSYELNPLWQKAIDRPRFFNIRHLLIVAAITGYLLFADFILPDAYDAFLTAACGAITIPYLTIIGRHTTNILIFSFLITHPNEVEGEVNTSQVYSIKTSQFNTLSYILIFTALYFYTRSIFILGGVIGCTLLFLAHFIWKSRINKK